MDEKNIVENTPVDGENTPKVKKSAAKKWKPVIITAIICVIAAVATLGAVLLIPQQENVVDFAPADEHEDIIISNKSAKMVESIEVSPSDGKDFEIIYTTDMEGNQVGVVKGAGDEFRYNNSDLYTIAGYVSYILAVEEIKDPQGRDDEFGFDKPRQKIKVNFKGNQKLELILGGDAPSGDGIYLKRADTGRVYLIGGSTAEMLMMSLVDYRDISLYDAYSTIYEINEISVKRPNDDKVTIRRKEGVKTNADGTPQDENAPRFELVSPDKSDADNSIVEDKVLTPFIGITVYDLIEDHPKDLSKYGLDDPTVIEVKDKYKNTHVIKVGDVGDKGGHYVMCDDVPSVLVTEMPISFVDIKHTEFMMKLIWSHDFVNVKQIQYTLPNGSNHTFVVSGGTNMTVDGTSVSQDNAINLFMHTIQFEIQDSVKGASYGAATHKIVVTKTDDSTQTLEFAPINERHYAAIINGQPAKYYVNVSQITELEDAFAILATGGNIPSIF
ncbi:MAG: DUF4340 domain-containing protein [Clostridia bacterium]|nr:DUF4340 domain-containing protein [Clostridia bacterium]